MSSDSFRLDRDERGVMLCAGCAQLGRCVLGIESEVLDEDGTLRVAVTCPADRQGVPGIAHGGWVADVFDEALGKRLVLAGMFGVTHSLNVRFIRPTPAGVALSLSAVHLGTVDDRWSISGELRIAESNELVAQASVVMVLRVSERHIAKFDAWRGTSV